MPYTRKRSKITKKKVNHNALLPLVGLMFVIWLLYRSLFQFDVWFDETIGKAIFFGLPVWLYISLTGSESIVDSFSLDKMNKGLFLGLAVGGIYGFVGSLLGLLSSGGSVQAVLLFSSMKFWGEFFLALMTGFWETLFFFSWIMIAILEKYKKRSVVWKVMLTALIFTVFHVPNSILRFSGFVILGQIFLMFLFAMGQALLFLKWRNLYALVLSHAIWGMVLLVHFI